MTSIDWLALGYSIPHLVAAVFLISVGLVLGGVR